jgi:diguanylate cyclase (GGDEF)-like protein
VHAQAEALADGRIDDPTLATRIPGRLGRALQATVTRLARSLSDGEHLREALRHEASHDALSGLPNRAAVLEALEHLIERGRARNETVAVLFIDLDDFKTMNDTHGHDAGDHILRTVAQRMRDVLRDTDVAGRLGGDEFIAILPHVDDVASVKALGDRLIAALSEPIVYENGKVLNVRATIGVALSQRRHEHSSELLREADAALYHGKRGGRGRTIVVDETLRAELEERATFATRFGDALAAGELTLHYQPIVELDTGVPRAVEALVRWEPPGRPLVMPDAFIPRIEHTPLASDLGHWALRQACEQLVAWSDDRALSMLRIAVNISPYHVVRGPLIEDVHAALDATGVDPGRLLIEITNTASIANPDEAVRVLDGIRALGVRVAIDDFDTVNATLNYLQRFPADFVKLDRALFVEPDERTRKIAALVADVARTLGLRIVAERIETAEEEATAREFGCDFVQGYRYAHAVPAADTPAVVRRLAKAARASDAA